MIYTNKEIKATEVKLEFGSIFQIHLGERGRGRKLLALTCYPDTVLKSGMNEEYTIGFTKSGKPRIIKKKDDTIYLLLTSEGGYTRRGNGCIGYLDGKKEDFKLLAIGNGADGDAGRIGQWLTALIKINNKDEASIIRITPAGGRKEDQFFIVSNGQVSICTFDTMDECCEAIGIDFPFNPIRIERSWFKPSNPEEEWEENDGYYYKKTYERGLNDWQWKTITSLKIEESLNKVEGA